MQNSDSEELAEQLNKTGRVGPTPLLRSLDEVAQAGARKGVEAAIRFYQQDLSHSNEEMGSLAKALR